MKGIIMGGGKASRLGRMREKALLEVGGRTLLERSADALHVEGIDEIIIAYTNKTPKTRELATKMKLSAHQTSAEGYHEDTLDLLDVFGPFISLNVDIPFIEPRHVRKLIGAAGTESVAAVVPLSFAIGRPDRDSVGDDGTGKSVIWIGLNFVTPSPETTLLFYDDPLLSININSEENLALARKMVELSR